MLRVPALMLCGVLLAGCASVVPTAPPPLEGVLHDEAFAAPADAIDARAVFALSDEMQAFIEQQRAGLRRSEDPRSFFFDMLYRRQRLSLEYDSALTRTAAEAFAARRGNCLSLAIMTAAFARAMDLPVRFQRVLVGETWSRSGTLQFASGHVNLALDEPPPAWMTAVKAMPRVTIIDFLPGDEVRRYPSQTIGEKTIVAMFMNNRAAEALAGGRLDDAYGWAREAVLQDRSYTNAYNTLGVVYLRRGLAREAGRVFDLVLAREPDNTKVMGNQVAALRAQGRDAEAERLAAALKAIEPYPPFHFFNAGLEAMKAADWAGARELFRRELRREAYFHEIHFWLAQAELRLGNLRAAREALEQARTQSTTPEQQEIYAGKLDVLKRYLR